MAFYSKELTDAYIKKRKELYESLHETDLNKFMYEFGVGSTSYYHLGELIKQPASPVIKMFKPYWDVETLRKIRSGADDDETKDIDDWSQEVDDALGEDHHKYYDYLILRALKYNRPVWCLFYLLGEIQGSLNYYGLTNDNGFKLTETDYNRIVSHLPLEFVSEYGVELSKLFTIFDELGYRFEVNGNTVSIHKVY